MAHDEDVDFLEHAQSPKRARTDEGSIEERSTQELIDADRYTKAQHADRVPWGLRIARSQPGGTLGRS